MKIKHLEYYNDEDKWRLEPVNFLPNLNLLVGVSGAGKTRILKAINSLKSIANGASYNGVKWSICFLSNDNHEYSWMGEFETKGVTISIDGNSEENEQCEILSEKLICNGTLIVERTRDEIIFRGEKTPKLSPSQSVISLLKQEDSITPIKESLNKISLIDLARADSVFRLSTSFYKRYEKISLTSLKESNLSIQAKLFVLYRDFPMEFEQVKNSFIKVFPDISDVKIEIVHMTSRLRQLLDDVYTINIKEKKIQNWIDGFSISSGMFKALMYISELYLSPDNCTILIDEFENSLGINCLDSVTELILNNRNLQFIITSHHPYIINNFSPACWRIVTRKGDSVTVKDAQEFHISESRQKAFIDLINVLEDKNLDE